MLGINILTALCDIPGNFNLQRHCCENLKSQKFKTQNSCSVHMRCTVQFGIAVALYCCKKSVVHAVNCAHVSFKFFSAMMIDFLGFHTMYRFSVLWMDVMSLASGWLIWFRWMLQLWRGGNSFKLPYIWHFLWPHHFSIHPNHCSHPEDADNMFICSFIHSKCQNI